MDVKSTYLNVSLDHKIYVDPPKGFEGKIKLMFGNLENPYMD